MKLSFNKCLDYYNNIYNISGLSNQDYYWKYANSKYNTYQRLGIVQVAEAIKHVYNKTIVDLVK